MKRSGIIGPISGVPLFATVSTILYCTWATALVHIILPGPGGHEHKLQPKETRLAAHRWLIPIILATQKVEIRRIVV
jgi:hypothetical protein